MCSILNALEERRKEREKQATANQELFQQQAESVEKKAWREFWDSESPGLLLYACLHGTVDIVKYFVSKLVSPTIRYPFLTSYQLCLHDVNFWGMYMYMYSNTHVQYT